MKLKQTKVAILAATLITFGSLAGGANAALTLSNTTVTNDSITFTISGTVSGPAPSTSLPYLFITTGNSADDFISSSDLTPALSGSVSTNGNLFNEFYIEDFADGDAFSFGYYSSGLSIGDSISGTLTMTAASPVVTEQLFIDNGFSIFWGRSSSGGVQSGTLQGTISAVQETISAVPEPSSAIPLGIGALGVALRRKRTA